MYEHWQVPPSEGETGWQNNVFAAHSQPAVFSHASSYVQTVPQPPQLARSVCVSTQEAPHAVWPTGHWPPELAPLDPPLRALPLDEPLLDEALPLDEPDEPLLDEALPLDEPDEPLLDEALPLDEPDEPLLDEALPLDEAPPLDVDEPKADEPSSVTPPESATAPALPSSPGRSEIPRSDPHALAPRSDVSAISAASRV
jgi:hypothetical protein